MNWRPRWLEAAGDLRPWRAGILVDLEAAHDAIACVMAPPRLDVLVERVAGAVIPETGTMGRAFRPGLFSLTVDPDNPNFAISLAGGELRRTAVHEAHHCMRMAGPGYGDTLGEGLVSEGLAGQFVRHLFGTPPDPWERAVNDDVLARHLPDPAVLAAADYDHGDWFFGTGGRPRWLGYTLGFRVVEDWLAGDPPLDGRRWVDVAAEEVISASRLGGTHSRDCTASGGVFPPAPPRKVPPSGA